ELHVGWISLLAKTLDQSTRLGVRFLLGLATELAQEPTFAFGQHGDALGMKVLLPHVLDENVVHAFKADGLRLANFRNVVSRGVDVFVSEHQCGALLRPVDEPDFGAEDDHARALRADQGTRDVKASFGKKLIQTVAGDAARDPRITAADEISVLVSQRAQA